VFGWSEFRVKVFGLSTFYSVLASNCVEKRIVFIFMALSFLERAGAE